MNPGGDEPFIIRVLAAGIYTVGVADVGVVVVIVSVPATAAAKAYPVIDRVANLAANAVAERIS